MGIELDNGNILDTMELSLSPLTQLLHLLKSLGLVIHPNTNNLVQGSTSASSAPAAAPPAPATGGTETGEREIKIRTESEQMTNTC